MPQMMPINWMMSFLFFICIFIMFNMLNYYIFSYKINTNYNNNNMNKNYKKLTLTWKW